MSSTWWDVLVLNAIVLALAVLLDRLLPEPPSRIHPVVWIGRTVAFLKRPAPQRPAFVFLYGCVIVVAVVGFWSILALITVTVLKSLGSIAYVAGGAVILRTTFTVKGLTVAAEKTRQTLVEGRLEDARVSLRHLVSRDAASLSGPLVAAAAIESVAENTTDSYIAPWLAFAILGVSGVMAYRAINTLDSMLGHRGPLEYLGKASARLDDVVNLVPARLSALLLLIAGSLCRLPVRRGWQTMLRDQSLTASPNAGWTMSAMAGLMGTRLEKVGHYCLGQEMPEPDADDISKAVRIGERAAALALFLALGLLAARHAILGLI